MFQPHPSIVPILTGRVPRVREPEVHLDVRGGGEARALRQRQSRGLPGRAERPLARGGGVPGGFA